MYLVDSQQKWLSVRFHHYERTASGEPSVPSVPYQMENGDTQLIETTLRTGGITPLSQSLPGNDWWIFQFEIEIFPIVTFKFLQINCADVVAELIGNDGKVTNYSA